MTTTTFELTDRKLLNILQSEFPLVDEPFRNIGDRLDIPDDKVISRVAELKARNVIRQISAIFDTRRLGYSTSLIAMRFKNDALGRCAQIINRHPGVSHNYGREGHFNLWFTIAVPPGESLEDTVAAMALETAALGWRPLPTLKFFKIGVNFDMVNTQSNSREYFVPDAPSSVGVNSDWNKAQPLSQQDIEFIRGMQDDLDLIPRPFDAISDRLGMTNAALFDYAADMVERKLMRRFSAVLHHRRAGFLANAMVVWKVPPQRSQEVGEKMAASQHVTHCYERPTYDDWPYSHYTMIHATTREECELIADSIGEAIGISDRQLVFSTREYKKTRVRYFV